MAYEGCATVQSLVSWLSWQCLKVSTDFYNLNPPVGSGDVVNPKELATVMIFVCFLPKLLSLDISVGRVPSCERSQLNLQCA